MKKNKSFKNLGVLIGSQPKDWAGGTIPYEIRNPSGDWTPYLPVGEIQRSVKEDWMDCTVRSGTNVIEIQEKQQTGIESNYCEREAAIGAKVTKQGAYLWQFAEYARTTGLAQQNTWLDSDGTWDEQYTPATGELRAKLDAEKKGWMTKWEILHEDITDLSKKSLQYHLKHAPLQVVIPGHAITHILSLPELDRIFDSYPPYVKDVPGSKYPGPIVAAKKIVLYKKAEALDPDILLIDLKKGDIGSQVLRLKRALWRLGFKTEVGDVYDDNVCKAVLSYQLSNVWTTKEERQTWEYFWIRFWHKGDLVEAKTRQSINNNLKFRK